MQLGDSAICYAAGWRVVFAIVDVVSHPENDPTRTRWQWRFAIEPRVFLEDLREAPPVEAAGVFPRSLGRHSYVRLTDEQFDAARVGIEGAAPRLRDPVRDDVRRIVEDGYDAMADRFAEWQREIGGSRRVEWVEGLLALLPERPDVLELGSGAGVRSTRMLAERGTLVGVDVSGEQVRRARERVPEAKFLHADFSELELADGSFDAVVALYVLNHVPQHALAPLLANVARWLRAGGYLLAVFPTRDNPGFRGEWLGVEMFFAGFGRETNRRLVEAAGLDVVSDETETLVEPGYGEATWQWLLGRKPA